jgi:hypothetical protein
MAKAVATIEVQSSRWIVTGRSPFSSQEQNYASYGKIFLQIYAVIVDSLQSSLLWTQLTGR